MLLGVDVGGTFTDAVLVDGQAIWTGKVPSTPGDPALGVFAALDAVLRSAGRPAGAVTRFAHGMTVATNALLEGRFARTALVATEGFVDLVELARQARPHLYRLCERGPAPLAPRALRFGAPERASPTGVLEPLDRARAAEMLEALAQAQPQAVAVVLLHSFAHPAHERALGELIAARLPGVQVTLSHELVGTFREYERAATTELDAALSPLVAGYLGELASRAEAAGLPEPAVMQSSGGLVGARRAAAHAALTVLSGPAGGVGGARLLASLAGEQDVLCFDMGGTSCDVCVIRGGEVSETAERAVAGRPLALPALDIHTVGAGGGSIAWRDPGGALRVGPQSAGALPGPACYGRGGVAPTVTDANLLLGRLPAGATLGGAVELDADAARHAVGALAQELQLGLEECAAGIVRVAEAEMLRALRVMTIERGVDPRELALMGFGGAGPLHAATMAQELGITRVLCPRASGVLSALGLAAAPARRDVSRTVMLADDAGSDERLAKERERLLGRAYAELGAPAGEPVNVRVRYELRYAGQSFELPVEVAEPASFGALVEAFGAAHERRYGYREERGEVELVTIRVSARTAPPAPEPAGDTDELPQRRRAPAVLDGAQREVEWLIGDLPAGTAIAGPALCALPEATLLVPPGWHGEVDDHGTVMLRHADP